MTIDEVIKTVAEESFPSYTYVYNDWYDSDQAIDRNPLPAIVHLLPSDGTMYERNNRIYDRETVSVCFFDKVARDASGDDQREVVDAMKAVGYEFIRALNDSGYLQPIESWTYRVYYNQLSSIVTGVEFVLVLEDNGSC